MPRPIRCPKCGLMQMAREACKKCQTPFAEHAVSSAPVRAARVSAVAQAESAAAQPSIAVAVSELEPEPLPEVGPDFVPSEPPPAPPAHPDGLDVAFDRDRFLLRQKVLTLHERYEIWDEDGQPILYVERPGRYLRNIAATLAGVASGALLLGGFIYLSSLLGPGLFATASVIAGVLFGLVALVAVSTALSAKRHLYFYRDETKAEQLLQVLQDQKFVLFTHTYTVLDANGAMLARFTKNLLTDVFRKKWRCYGPDGSLICVAKEDSLVKALIRRFATRLLPLNFHFYRGETEQLIGRFDRKFTLLDRYVLDLAPDLDRALDRRIGVALGVMLDTGEKR